jgi:hypothetical protein
MNQRGRGGGAPENRRVAALEAKWRTSGGLFASKEMGCLNRGCQVGGRRKGLQSSDFGIRVVAGGEPMAGVSVVVSWEVGGSSLAEEAMGDFK